MTGCHAFLSRSGHPAVDPEHTHVTLSKWSRGSQMGHLGAELDLGPIDKVDVHNEIRRVAVLWASEADSQNFGFLLRPKVGS